MNEVSVQRILIEYVLRHAPQTLADECERLGSHYGRRLLAARSECERRMIARDYEQAKVAMVITLAREISILP